MTKRANIWIVANLVGVALFLITASALWPEPQDVSSPTGPGEAFYWLLRVAPFLLVSILGNIFVLIHIIRTRQRAPLLRLSVWLFIVGIWLAASSYSNHRSMHYITSQVSPPCTSRVA